MGTGRAAIAAICLLAVLLLQLGPATSIGAGEFAAGAVTADSAPPTGLPHAVLSRTGDADALGALRALGGYFIENDGQVEEHVRYYARGEPAVAFRDDGIMFTVAGRTGVSVSPASRVEAAPVAASPLPTLAGEAPSFAYLIRFDSAQPAVPIGREELPFQSNFLLGNDPSRWRIGVRNFREIVYPGVFPGIDLAFHMSTDGLKYEFEVRPGSDPASIRMTVEGAGSVAIRDGGLAIATPIGHVRDSAPISYQEDGASVECQFALRAARTYGFDCAGRDASKALTIDPLVYSTFLGGRDDAFFGYFTGMDGKPQEMTCGQGDRGVSIDVDRAGNAYVLGSTCSWDFPTTPGAFDANYRKYWDPTLGRYVTGDSQQLFLAKLNPSGSALVYATYIGGGDYDVPASIAVDAAGNAYLAGTTLALDYPTTPGAFQRSFTCWDVAIGYCSWNAFVTELNAQGNGLVYSTFLGGRGYQMAWSLAIDAAGNAYVAGETNSTDFPTTAGAYDRTFNSNYGRRGDFPDVFVTKVDPTGGGLAYSTFIGGAGWEWPYALVVDPAGAAYVAGDTNSTNFPVTPGAFDQTPGGPMDAFVLKLNAAGSALAYSTRLGGNGWENGRGIAVDSAGAAYVTGDTNSTDFPVTPGAFRTVLLNGRDAFVTKLDPSGAGLAYSTFLGGSTFVDAGTAIAVDARGYAYVTGFTYSGDFPVTPDAFDTILNGREGFVTEFNAAGSGLLYSTFLGGSGDDDQGSSVRVDGFGIAYVTGWTNSSDFPTTPDAFDRTLAGKGDAFIVKLLPVTAANPPDLAITPLDIAFSPTPPAPIGSTVTLTATVHNIGGTNASNVLVRFFDGPPAGSNQIGSDQVLPFVERFYGSGRASVAWTATPLGTHAIWILVDPASAIPEMREDNNEAAKSIDVAPLQPDLTVTGIRFAPSPPYHRGTLVRISATIENVGGAASGPTGAQFHDGVPPSVPIGPEQPVASLPPGGVAVVSVPWNATAVGTRTICAVADPGDFVAERNETNNTACAPAKVLGPPDLEPVAVDLSPTSPLPYGTAAGVNVTIVNWGEEAAVGFDVLLFRDGNGNQRPDAGENLSRIPVTGLGGYTQTWAPIPWRAAPLGTVTLCVDADPPPGTVAEYNENNNVRCTSVTVQPQRAPPTTTFVVGSPNVTAAETFVTSATPLAFTAVDASGTGIRNTTYRVDNLTWGNYTATGPFTLAADGEHLVEWFSEDFAGDIEPVRSARLFVDTTPPTPIVGVGSPRYVGPRTYVTSGTPVSLSAIDGGVTPVGLASLEYGIDGGPWAAYGTPFTIPQPDGSHGVAYRATDLLGNAASGIAVLVVDDTPPVTAIAPAAGPYSEDTRFTLAATDGGSGVDRTEYGIDGGAWTAYASDFALTAGAHNVSYRSVDRLGNSEAVHTLPVLVEGPATPPPAPPAVETNYKPLVAAIFALVLALVGVWSSRRAPWPSGGRRRLRAFMIASLPFVLVEGATGVASQVTGFLAMPPVVGLGTGVDTAILLAGLAVSGSRVWRRARRAGADGTGDRC